MSVRVQARSIRERRDGREVENTQRSLVDVRIPGYGPESESLKCRPWEQFLPPSRSSSKHITGAIVNSPKPTTISCVPFPRKLDLVDIHLPAGSLWSTFTRSLWKSNSESETTASGQAVVVDVGTSHHLGVRTSFKRHGCPSYSEPERVPTTERLMAPSHIDASWCVIHSQALICC